MMLPYCNKHKKEKECLAGASAHHSNWYCDECDKEKIKGAKNENKRV